MGVDFAMNCVLLSMMFVIVALEIAFPRRKGIVRAEFIKAVIATVALMLLMVKQLVVRLPYGDGSVFLGVAAPVTALLTAIAAVKLYRQSNYTGRCRTRRTEILQTVLLPGPARAPFSFYSALDAWADFYGVIVI